MRDAARKAHYCPAALALRNPSRTYRVCAGLVATAAVAGAVGWAISDRDDPLVPLGLLTGGTVLAAFAAVLALATFLLTRSDPPR